MAIAVTAANGKLGSAIIKQLIADLGAENVIGIARSPKKAAHLGVEIRKGDYDLEADFEKALVGVDQLLMISGLAEPDVRVEQHQKIIRAAQKNGVSKLVYTSILGNEGSTGFAPVVKSMRQTEADVRNSGIAWAIGRNGMYIESDLSYVKAYAESGIISNSAGAGKSSYTSYPELARAYSKLLTDDALSGQTYNLTGDPVSQAQLADLINEHFETKLAYETVSVEAYYEEKLAAYGPFFGNIVGGIYEGIKLGYYEVASDFQQILNRPHKTAQELVAEFQEN